MKMKTKRKITHTLVLVAFAIITFIWFVFMFWWLFPYKTVEINQQPYLINNTEIKQGGMLNYIVDACNYTEIIPEVKKQFVDGIVYSISDGVVILPLGCHKTIVSVKIPKNLPVGEYYLKIYINYKMNPIRNIASEYETKKFIVTK